MPPPSLSPIPYSPPFRSVVFLVSLKSKSGNPYADGFGFFAIPCHVVAVVFKGLASRTSASCQLTSIFFFFSEGERLSSRGAFREKLVHLTAPLLDVALPSVSYRPFPFSPFLHQSFIEERLLCDGVRSGAGPFVSIVWENFPPYRVPFSLFSPQEAISFNKLATAPTPRDSCSYPNTLPLPLFGLPPPYLDPGRSFGSQFTSVRYHLSILLRKVRPFSSLRLSFFLRPNF